MSGPCVHYLLAREIPYRWEVRREDLLGGRSFPDIMRDHPVHASIGAQGPDFLFFLLADVLGTAGSAGGHPSEADILGQRLAKAMLDVSHQIETLNAQLFEAAPILEDVLDAKERFEQAADGTIEKSQSLSALRDGAAAIKQLVQLMGTTVLTGVKATLADTIDIFSLMAHPMQAAEPLEHWWWFDVLHYRRSGEYATALLQRAIDAPDPELLSYAIGYTSHYAADTVGHPYVNTIVRGPYRLHGQRHKVVENGHDVWAWREFGDDRPRLNAHIDVAAYLHDRFGTVGGAQQMARIDDGEFATSQLHLEYQFDPRFTLPGNPPTQAERDLLPTLDPSITLPDSIAEGIRAAMTDVYGDDRMADGRYPRIPEAEEIKVAYRLWYGWFRGSTSNGVLPQALGGHVPLTEDLAREVLEILGGAAEAAGHAVEALGEAGRQAAQGIRDLYDDLKGRTWNFNFDADAILGMIKELADKILEGVEEVLAIVDELAGPLVERTVSVVKTLINILYQKLYGLYLHFRKLLAASGLGFPTTAMLEEQRFRHMIEPRAHADATGRRLSDADVRDNYPMLPLARASFEIPVLGPTTLSFMKDESHLVYPPIVPEPRIEAPDRNARELPALPGPPEYEYRTPEFYMWDAPAAQPRTLAAFLNAGDGLRGFAETEAQLKENAREGLRGFADLHADVAAQEQSAVDPEQIVLGNAVDLTIALVQHVVDGRTLPNVNLDGDRGMAFPSWIMNADWYGVNESGGTPPVEDVGRVNVLPDPRV